MKIDPNTTPEGISLKEIRELTRRNSSQVRFFRIKTKNHSLPIVALPKVYLSDDFGDSRYFAKKIPEFVNGRFLEIGTGTGVVAIATAIEYNSTLSRNNEKFVAIDINPQAVKNAEMNVVINGINESIDIRFGDVFQPLKKGERFDTIFWNHPFHKGNVKESIIQRACFDPQYRGLEEYVRNGHNYLNEGGKLLLGSGNFADLNDIRVIVNRYGCEMNLLHYIHWPFEATCGELKTFNIYEIRKKRNFFQ